VIRTHSGSLISDFSKQPTPAPSSPDAEQPEVLDAQDSRVASMHDDVNLSLSAIASPVATPTRGPTMQEQLATEVDRYKRLVHELKAAAADQESIIRNKV
jgi:hypothetical protein